MFQSQLGNYEESEGYVWLLHMLSVHDEEGSQLLVWRECGKDEYLSLSL